jgi:hypothetical protein
MPSRFGLRMRESVVVDGKPGLEVKADHTQGGFRWLTVGVEGEAVPEIRILQPKAWHDKKG